MGLLVREPCDYFFVMLVASKHASGFSAHRKTKKILLNASTPSLFILGGMLEMQDAALMASLL